MPRQNELLCKDCEYLHKTAIKTGNLIVMLCMKFNIELEKKDYTSDAYRCYMCRNEIKGEK